jgi:hypothetical protein
MTEKDQETLDSLIKGSLLGAGLTALLKSGKADGEDLAVGALLGAALVAAFQASQRAEKTDVPVLIQEGESLFWKHADGKKVLYKHLPKAKYTSQSKFKLS